MNMMSSGAKTPAKMTWQSHVGGMAVPWQFWT